MSQKRFGIDIDGTVTCPASLVPFLNEAFSLNITLEDIKQYDLSAALNIPPDKMRDWFDQTEPAIYAASPLAEGADSILAKWQKQFHLLFISARRQHLFDVTEKWFQDKQIYYDHIELIGSHDKVEAAKRHKVDIFFEDKHDNAVTLAEELHIPVVLFNTPYNQDPVPDRVVRVNNWHEADLWVQQWLEQGEIHPLIHT
ncbi:hypothetical protein RRU94_14390 [Domibacillus sp. DTU_2020_1001157_1_SI_ALB_TIR_016]|uniref:hypothetical protein n=1 Tax=Domibacillus sp. DTU_2020_1001157_1_SI_ALB_TIR_016 TaxID=3077789 RepID=UPI0028E26304|nr:hypothetical protein [Domibacillus sp. DTU_2020_1001157_1_SI_ALB_TIR_016]WNS81946.1 hypothetical protein RRU94_14390 [Domibacillus sp. DTU_2020_1001157_1_SI_ALB_TIR_016]